MRGVVQRHQARHLVQRQRRIDHVPLAAFSRAHGVAIRDSVAREHDRRPAFRGGRRRDRHLGDLVEAAAMGKGPSGECALQDLGDLFESRLVGLRGDPHAGELVGAIGTSQTEHESAPAQQVERDGVLGQPDRVVEGRDGDAGARRQPPRRTEHGGADWDDCRGVPVRCEVVLGDPERVETDFFGEQGLAHHVLVQLTMRPGRIRRPLRAVHADAETHRAKREPYAGTACRGWKRPRRLQAEASPR